MIKRNTKEELLQAMPEDNWRKMADLYRLCNCQVCSDDASEIELILDGQ